MSDIIDTKPDTEEKKDKIKTNDSGHLVAQDAEQMWRIATMAIKSGFVPKAYQRPEQVVIAMQFAVGLGLPASVASLQEIAVINGKPSIFGDLPLKLVRESGKLEKFKEYLIDKDYKPISLENKNLDSDLYAAVCEIKRKGYEEKTFTWTMKQQQQTKNNNPVWRAYPTIMLKRKARSLALKDEFADILGPISIAEYNHETIPDVREVNEKPRQNEADKFESMFGSENE